MNRRAFCGVCRKPQITCYCSRVKSYALEVEFVFLVHPEEARNGIATARMAHSFLAGSHLVVGEDFSQCAQVNKLIGDGHGAWVLYPGEDSVNLSNKELSGEQLKQQVKRVFVIDGKWRKVRRMLESHPELASLPRLAFSPGRPSRFLVRRQPNAHCLSTLEAVGELLLVLGEGYDQPVPDMLACFEQMVAEQVEYERQNRRRKGLEVIR